MEVEVRLYEVLEFWVFIGEWCEIDVWSSYFKIEVIYGFISFLFYFLVWVEMVFLGLKFLLSLSDRYKCFIVWLLEFCCSNYLCLLFYVVVDVFLWKDRNIFVVVLVGFIFLWCFFEKLGYILFMFLLNIFMFFFVIFFVWVNVLFFLNWWVFFFN